MQGDPTYAPEEIEANTEWQLAFLLSELTNDNAPIGWSKYIWQAQAILKFYQRRDAGPSADGGKGGTK